MFITIFKTEYFTRNLFAGNTYRLKIILLGLKFRLKQIEE